jgi:hypothetical protein
MAQARTPAQEAANHLALAARTALESQGVTSSSLESQSMGRHGNPTQDPTAAQAGQPQPSQQPGHGEQAGYQTTKPYQLPPELAQLGLSPDDWVRLRGLVQGGVEGSPGDKVPAEYRELVKNYFRALATQGGKP